MFDTVEDCLAALRRGEIVLVTDDEDRENEGDCICAAEFATRENVNFMATYAKGLICMPMSRQVREARPSADGGGEHRQPPDGVYRLN